MVCPQTVWMGASHFHESPPLLEGLDFQKTLLLLFDKCNGFGIIHSMPLQLC